MEGYIAKVESFSERHWPGHSSAVFFLSGCNFRCPFCNASSILEFREEHRISIREAFREIEKTLSLIDSVFITGGEPLLQRALCEEISLFASRNNLEVGLDTNGSKPFALASLLKKHMLHYINMDIKAPLTNKVFERVTRSKTFFKPIDEIIKDTLRSIELIKEYDEEVEVVFSTTIVPGMIYRKSHLLAIGGLIRGINAEWHLKPFMPSEEVLSPLMRQVEAPSRVFMERLKKALLEEYPNMRIRIS